MNKFISIGNISRLHGYKGSLVVHSPVDKDSALSYLKQVFIGKTEETSQSYQLTEAAWMPSGWKISLDGVTNEESAKLLQRLNVYALRSDLKELKPNEYFVSDLVGYKGIDEKSGLEIGTFKETSELSTSDGKVSQQSWIFVNHLNEEISIPAVKRYILGVSQDKKTISLQNTCDLILESEDES